MTKRRDYTRKIQMVGYFKFTKEVFSLIFNHKKIFFSLIGLIGFANILLVGLLDQNFINSLYTVVDATNSGLNDKGFGEIGKAGLLVLSTFSSGGLIASPTQSQQMIMVIIALFAWLAVIQICRDIFAGNKNLILRDALYSCGRPIIPMFAITLVIALQAIPIMVVIIIVSAAVSTGFTGGFGVEYMLFSGAMLLFVSLSLYWIMGSIFALIISTIRGVYPFQALKISGDMVSQRRLAILFRILWAILVLTVMWLVILIPLVILMNWLSSFWAFATKIPLIQLTMVALTGFSLVFSSCYLYLLYRKVVDADQRA